MNRVRWAAVLLTLAACKGGEPAEEEVEPQVPVGIATVAADTMTDAVSVVGRLAPTPGGSALLTAPAAGVVSRIAVQVGATVGRGASLLELSVPDLEQNARALAAAADAAEKDAKRQQDLLAQGVASEKQAQQRQADAVAARAQADAAAQLLGQTHVRSPIAGAVQRVAVHLGERVDANAVLVEVIDASTLDLAASVPAADLAHLKVGQAAQVTPDGGDRPVAGRIAAIAPAVDSLSNAAQVIIRLPNPQQRLRAGSGATGTVVTGRRSGVLVIPDSALVVVGDSLTVFVVEGDSVAHARPVTVGARRAGRAEIRAGLTAGERIVVSGAFGLVDGMHVVPAKPAEPADSAKSEQP